MLQYHWKWPPQQDIISVLKSWWPTYLCKDTSYDHQRSTDVCVASQWFLQDSIRIKTMPLFVGMNLESPWLNCFFCMTDAVSVRTLWHRKVAYAVSARELNCGQFQKTYVQGSFHYFESKISYLSLSELKVRTLGKWVQKI